jgi:hypothetical protein
MPRYLIKSKGYNVDYMVLPKGMTLAKVNKLRRTEGIRPAQGYTLIKAKNMTQAMNTLLRKQGRIGSTERVVFKRSK